MSDTQLQLTPESVSTKVIKWNADESFVPKNTSEFFSDALVAKWNTIMPGKSTGLVDPTSAKQTLVAGASQPGGPDSQRFSATSMTHQLHCLVRNRPPTGEDDTYVIFHCCAKPLTRGCYLT